MGIFEDLIKGFHPEAIWRGNANPTSTTEVSAQAAPGAGKRLWVLMVAIDSIAGSADAVVTLETDTTTLIRLAAPTTGGGNNCLGGMPLPLDENEAFQVALTASVTGVFVSWIGCTLPTSAWPITPS
jgi:hypothetical protein